MLDRESEEGREEVERERGKEGEGWEGERNFKQIKRKGRGEGRSTSILLTVTLARELNSCLELLELFAPPTIEQCGLYSVRGGAWALTGPGWGGGRGVERCNSG